MEISMTVNEVLSQLRQLQESGKSVNKKKLKESHPKLVENALYYYPSWEHALRATEKVE
jgi:hypothetical protein